MPTLFLDFETRSAVSLEEAGAWRYAADPTTEVLCAGYAVDDADPQIWIPGGGDPNPAEVVAAANDPGWNVVAHNFQFERAIATRILTPRYGWPEIPLVRQICSMSLALASALPGALDKAAVALGLPLEKDREGYRLMRKMSRPLPRRKGDPPDLIRWHDNPADRERLYKYCKRDVAIERLLFRALPPLPSSEQALFVFDASVNERGFHVDVVLAQAARAVAHNERLAINVEIAKLTGGEISSVDQVAKILAFVRRHGHLIASLNKRSVSAVLAHEPSDAVRHLLELRREGARASARKLDRLLVSVDADQRLRGTLRYHASSTGRWSGRNFQPQNLKKVETADIDAAVDAVLAGDTDRIRALGAPLTIAGDVSRSIVCAAPGHRLIGGDFSAIESRVLAGIAGEGWKITNYAEYDTTGRPELEPYCATATRILKRVVTPEDEPGRAIGKTADLGLGYGGALGAWRQFNPDDTRPDGEILLNIEEWRRAHPAIVRFWKALERAAKRAVATGQRIELNRFSLASENGTLFVTLPSGRRLAYPEARLGPGKFEGTRQIYFKDNARGGWTECRGWYGTFVENVVQAVARDLLSSALQRIEAAGYPVVLHVHDEVICEVPEGFGSTTEFHALMTQLPDWTRRLPIAAKVWTGPRYAKTKSTVAAQPAVAASVEVNGKASPIAATPAPIIAPVEDDEDNEDGPAWINIPLADLIGEPLVGGKICCPFHEDHAPSLQIYPDHYHCYVCSAHGNHLDWLLQVEGMDRATALRALKSWDGPRQIQPPPDEGEARRAFALQLWEQAQRITGTLGACYLRETRKIDLAALPASIDEALRFHPRCPFGPGSYHPCLIALMRNATTDAATGIQRIALTADAQKIDRRMLGRSGVVKLWPPGSQLVVGEGLETVLAAATRIPYCDAPLQPAWAALSSDALGRFPLLPDVQRLIILVDHDPSGETAALICTDRWSRAARVVVQLKPDQPGTDFNDLVLSE